MISLLRKEGLRCRNSPICTLSQNGYGDRIGDIALYGAQQKEGDTNLSQKKKTLASQVSLSAHTSGRLLADRCHFCCQEAWICMWERDLSDNLPAKGRKRPQTGAHVGWGDMGGPGSVPVSAHLICLSVPARRTNPHMTTSSSGWDVASWPRQPRLDPWCGQLVISCAVPGSVLDVGRAGALSAGAAPPAGAWRAQSKRPSLALCGASRPPPFPCLGAPAQAPEGAYPRK